MLLGRLVKVLAAEYRLVLLLLLLLLEILSLKFIHNLHSGVFLDRWCVNDRWMLEVILCQNYRGFKNLNLN